jgi:hypothetical protein
LHRNHKNDFGEVVRLQPFFSAFGKYDKLQCPELRSIAAWWHLPKANPKTAKSNKITRL